MMAKGANKNEEKAADGREVDKLARAAGAQGAAGAPVRVREYFPETMLWQPALITDDKGRATLPVTFADSITTWRLSASASSRPARSAAPSSRCASSRTSSSTSICRSR